MLPFILSLGVTQAVRFNLKAAQPVQSSESDQCIIYELNHLDADLEKWAVRDQLYSADNIQKICKDNVDTSFAQEQLSLVSNMGLRDSSLGLVAVDKDTGEVCGFSYGWKYPKTYECTLLCSHRGYGRKLLDASLEWAVSQSIELAVLKSVLNAVGFYRKQSYKPCDNACEYRCKQYKIENDTRMVFMSRCLKGGLKPLEPWGPGIADITTRFTSLLNGERVWQVDGRTYRCCCKDSSWCQIIDTTDKMHFPREATSSTCGRYVRGYRSWNSDAHPFDKTCVVEVTKLPKKVRRAASGLANLSLANQLSAEVHQDFTLSNLSLADRD